MSEWVDDQLKRAKASQPVQTSVKRLLEVWDTMNHTDDTMRQTLEAFHQLALGYTIVPDEVDEKWGPVEPGYYNVGDTVRVKKDGYPGQLGERYNGKRGRIIGVRGGKVIVLHDDARDNEDQVYHEPPHLERLL